MAKFLLTLEQTVFETYDIEVTANSEEAAIQDAYDLLYGGTLTPTDIDVPSIELIRISKLKETN